MTFISLRDVLNVGVSARDVLNVGVSAREVLNVDCSARDVLNVVFLDFLRFFRFFLGFYRDNFTVSMPVAEEPEDRIATLLESEGFRRI